MTLPLLLASALAVTAPDGAAVCRVTPPDLGADARLETTNLPGGVAWRIRYDGTAPRTVAREEWTFDFGKDLRCWPVSHAQGEYVPRTLSAIASLKPNSRGTSECPLVVEGDGWTAALGDAGVTDYARLRFASGERPGQLKAVLEGPASFTAPFATPWRYVHVAKDCVALANAQPAFLDALNAPSRIADTSWIKPGKVLRVCSLSEQDGRACVDFAKRNNFQYVELDAGWYGPGDYTPCWNFPRIKNTLAHQLALPCVYSSGFQFLFWYQRPSQIKEQDPALDFWREIPCAFDAAPSAPAVVTVDPRAVVGPASPDLWGIFFEDIDLSLDGGVYAELVRNRSFEDGNGEKREQTLRYWLPPEPFGLKYLEIGNENGGKAYEERYALMAKAVRARYPDVTLIFDNWRETKRVDDPKDLRDAHPLVRDGMSAMLENESDFSIVASVANAAAAVGRAYELGILRA